MNIFLFQKKLRQTILELLINYKGFNEKNVTYATSGVTVYVFKGPYMWLSNCLLQGFSQFEVFSLSFALFLQEMGYKKNMVYKIPSCGAG